MMDAKVLVEEKLRNLKLVNRPKCNTYNPISGCYWCGNKTFRYYSSSFGKKYYQCERCNSINH